MPRLSFLKLSGLCLILLAAVRLPAQLPAGTLLPVMLSDSLDSDKSKAGENVSAKLKQDVPLPDAGRIRAGADVLGHVVSSRRAGGNLPADVVVVFDRIRSDDREIGIATSLRALGSMQAVFDAGQPINGTSQVGSSVWDWTTRQVGGDLVFRGEKKVKSKMGTVGTSPQPGWVLGIPRANPEDGCMDSGANGVQAFWVFSTDACGVYGTKDLQIFRPAPTQPPDQIMLVSSKRVQVRSGSGLLLTVLPQSTAKAAH